MKKMIALVMICIMLASNALSIFASDIANTQQNIEEELSYPDNTETSPVLDSHDKLEFPFTRGVEYYWSNSTINESYFNKTFNVTNSTHRYGKAYFSNTGTVSVSLKIYYPNGTLASQTSINAGSGGGSNFAVGGVTGSYNIIISNGGAQNIKGILSVATSDQPF